MQQWMGEERAFAVKAYYQNGKSLVRAQRAFCNPFNVLRNQPVPSNHAINTWVDNFEVSGSTSKKRGGRQNLCKLHRTLGRLERRLREVCADLPCDTQPLLEKLPGLCEEFFTTIFTTTCTRSRSFRLWTLAIMGLEYAFVTKCWT